MGLFDFLNRQVMKANDQYNKGYDKVSDMTDEKLKKKIMSSSGFERAGYMQVY